MKDTLRGKAPRLMAENKLGAQVLVGPAEGLPTGAKAGASENNQQIG